ncbi:hypothetical protein BH09PSE4_BH09PSE4_13630 [soil metagenome]
MSPRSDITQCHIQSREYPRQIRLGQGRRRAYFACMNASNSRWAGRSSRTFRIVLYALLNAAFLTWAATFALTDWYASLAPRLPDARTGATILMKGFHAAGFVNATQYFWLSTMLVPIWLCIAGPILGLAVATLGQKWKPTRLEAAISRVTAALFIALLLGEGHIISLAKTGNWLLPCERSLTESCFLSPDTAVASGSAAPAKSPPHAPAPAAASGSRPG